MERYKNIMVPIDGSDNSKRALKHAVELAKAFGAEVTLVYVANIISAISSFDQTPISGGYVSEQIAADMEETGKEVLKEFMDEVPDTVSVKTVFEVGSPGPAILAVAKKHDTDLIVMGSRGLGPFKGIFMGSVSSYIVSHCTTPVLIVK